MGDQRHPAGGKRIGLQITQRPQAGRIVDETHAARAAQRHTGCRGGIGELLAKSGEVGRAEYDGAFGSVGCGGLQFVMQRRVGHSQQNQVDWFVKRRQGRGAHDSIDAVVAGIHQVHTRRTSGGLDDHACTEAVGPGTGSDERHRPSAEHRVHRGAAQSAPGDRPGQERPPSAERIFRPPRFLSASAALAACQPGMPHTPPPAWVAELPL